MILLSILQKDLLNGKKHIHLIGIGGSGMYPLAQILHSKGFYITGSDNNETDTLDAIRKMGITVYFGQRAENIRGADLIVHTAAIMADNPELIAAKSSDVPVLERSELLGLITSWYDNAICVAGTHGKTTTTSMITQILYTAQIDLSAFIGGKLPCINGSGLAGKSDIMVCEACEFVDTFLKLYPDISVILNIDEDHLDYFKTLENIIKSFHAFCEKTTKAIIVNGDCENSMRAIEGITGKEIITFGLSEKNDYYAANIKKITGMQTVYTVMNRENKICDITINVAGSHNILNSLAAVVAALYVNTDIESIQKGLYDFRGAGRRFEQIGVVNDITIVDDYAHHPTEISLTLKAAMEMGYNRIWAIFQPFTFSRTARFLDDFAEALSFADITILTDIMGSREKNTFNIFAKDLGNKIDGCIYFAQDENEEPNDERKNFNFQQVCDYVCENAQGGDLIITLGCGDVYKVAKMIYKKLNG